MENTASFLDQMFSREKKKDAENVHEELARISAQYRSMQDILKRNADLLSEASKTNKGLEKALSTQGSTSIGTTLEKILDREKISSKEASELIKDLRQLTGNLAHSGLSLNTNPSAMLKNFQSVISDERVGVGTKRGVLSDTMRLLETSNRRTEVTPEEAQKYGPLASVLQAQLNRQTAVFEKEFKELKEINIKEMNFTKEETAVLNKHLSVIADPTYYRDMKATLEELEESMESSVLTNQKLEEVLSKQVGGSSLEAFFKAHPGLVSSGKGLGGGLAELGSEMAGIGTVFRLLKNLGPVLGSILAPLAPFIGLVGGVGLAGTAIYGMYKKKQELDALKEKDPAAWQKEMDSIRKAGAEAGAGSGGSIEDEIKKYGPAIPPPPRKDVGAAPSPTRAPPAQNAGTSIDSMPAHTVFPGMHDPELTAAPFWNE